MPTNRMYSNKKENRRLAIVLGVHRSGTSLMAAGLERLGAYLGNNLMEANNENPKGFFENEVIVAFNDRLLEYLGGRWDNPLFDGAYAMQLVATSDLKVFYDEAECLYGEQFSSRPFIAIKDPRICQLLPFWLNVFESCGYKKNNIYYVHTIRHPMEVARSQYKRQLRRPDFHGIGSDYFQTVALWMSMSYQALRDVESDNNIFTDYAYLINDPIHEFERVALFMQLNIDKKQLEKLCGNLVDPEMKHNVVDEADDRKLEERFPEAKQFYLAQKNLAECGACKQSELVDVLRPYKPTPYMQHKLQPLVPLLSLLLSQKIISHTNSLGYAQIRSGCVRRLSLFKARCHDIIRRLTGS